jgi:RNA polymerase sigma-70 factor (ECF subfamily)
VAGLEINIRVYDTEEELIAGLRRHDTDACTCMVKRFAPLVFAHARRMVGDADEAEEVLQMTFIKACEKIDSFAGRSALSTWLYRIATNEALMKLRGQSRDSVPFAEVADTIQAADMPRNVREWARMPAAAALDAELRAQLEAALLELPESLRVVFALRELQGLSTEETASVLGIGQSAVKVRLHRARLRLRELLAVYFVEETEEGKA